MGRGELRVTRQARPESAAAIRHALVAFLAALDVDENAQIDIVTAVGEALANTVEHAYADGRIGDVELLARRQTAAMLSVDVADKGTFGPQTPRFDRGLGLRIIRAAARSMKVHTGDGTTIRMEFDLSA